MCHSRTAGEEGRVGLGWVVNVYGGKQCREIYLISLSLWVLRSLSCLYPEPSCPRPTADTRLRRAFNRNITYLLVYVYHTKGRVISSPTSSVRRLCLKSQMWVDQNLPPGEMRKLLINGNKTQVKAAVAKIEFLLDSAPGNYVRPGKTDPEVRKGEGGGDVQAGWLFGTIGVCTEGRSAGAACGCDV